MEWDEAYVERMRGGLRLAVDPRQRRHGSGSRMGRGPGASLEFHDHRSYVPGDDPRHIDWRVLARTDTYVIRRYRQEVSPRVEVLLDVSASMAVDPAKAQLATTVAALLVELARSSGSRPAIWALGERPDRLDPGGAEAWRTALRRVSSRGAVGLSCPPVPGLSAGADRYLVSDGLCPDGGRQVVDRLGGGAGRICLVQVLTRTERDPQALGPVRLVDVEGGMRDLVHDEALCHAYKERLARHQAGWQAALNGRGAGLIGCHVEDGPEGAVRQLLRHGVVEAVAC